MTGSAAKENPKEGAPDLAREGGEGDCGEGPGLPHLSMTRRLPGKVIAWLSSEKHCLVWAKGTHFCFPGGPRAEAAQFPGTWIPRSPLWDLGKSSVAHQN